MNGDKAPGLSSPGRARRHPSRRRDCWTPAAPVHYNDAAMRMHGTARFLMAGWLACTVGLPAPFVAQRDDALAQADAPSADVPDLTSLNVRLSQQAIHPPNDVVHEVVTLPPAIRAARAKIAPSPKAAVLEDDHHHRVLVLSALDDGRLRAHVLEPLDFTPTIPLITACADARGCAYDRRPVTGGLGCVAICIRQALAPGRQP